MIERLLIVAAVAVLAAAAYHLFRRWEVWRVTRLAPGDPLLAGRRPNTPAILYFTTPFCAPCKTQQRPALRQLVDELGDQVQVIEVDATAQPDAANRWGVLSVPTTFILDRAGNPRQVNHGVTPLDTLRHQVQGL